MLNPCGSSRTWWLRFTVSDGAGCLAAATTALAELGVEILTLDVRTASATQVIDGATVSLPAWLDVPAVEYALLCAGATDVRAGSIPVPRFEDLGPRTPHLTLQVGAPECGVPAP